MIIDKWLSQGQALPATATTEASTNYMDFGAAKNFAVNAMWLVIQIETAVARTAGALGVTFAVQTDDNSSFSSATTIHTSGALAKATLVDGYVVAKLRIPPTCERYLRVAYTTDAADATGAVDAYLVMDADIS